MRLSTRNQLKGTITSIVTGDAMAVVKLRIDGTDIVVTSSITKDSVVDLGLEVGSTAYALIKSTAVQIGVDD